MIRWEHLATAAVPEGGTLELWRHGADLTIRVDGQPLMSTREHGSEDALGTLVSQRLADRPTPRVLVGGLGMGFTLAAALGELGPRAEVVVAELVPEVVQWNRQALAKAAGNPLDDPRVTVLESDVAELLRSSDADWDAVLLDVDNGPDGLSRTANRWLYRSGGLAATRRALRPGGIVGLWSAFRDDAFTGRVQRAGFDVELVPVRSRGTKGSRHFVSLWTPARR
jgi:spermidine synthase